MLKKTILVFVLFLFALSLSLFFYKKVTPKKIENKINQTINKIEEVKETLSPEPTKILSDGLPNKYLIKTAFVPQAPEKNWDQPWQDACEEAALLTVNYFYSKENPTITQIVNDLNSVFAFETNQGWGHDVNISQMVTVASDMFNLNSKTIDNPTVQDIKQYISQNIPIIVPANGKILFKENKYFKSGGPWYHAVVILGYDDDKKQFIVHDVGTQFGAYFHYSYSLLLESIHDFPKSGVKEDIDTGQKRILILLK